MPSARAEEPATGDAFRLLPSGWIPATGLGAPEGTIAGNRPAALPAPMSELETLFRPGGGPSGTAAGETAEALRDDLLAEADGDADAEVTVTVSDAEGGVHFAVVTMLAAAVSFTELTEFALAATAICALRPMGCLSVTELMVQEAAPLPLAQPLVNVGFWLAGCEVSVTVTPEADPFTVEIVTAYPAFCPRWMLDCELWTVTHSSVGALELALGLGLGLLAMKASSEAEVTVAAAEVEA